MLPVATWGCTGKPGKPPSWLDDFWSNELRWDVTQRRSPAWPESQVNFWGNTGDTEFSHHSCRCIASAVGDDKSMLLCRCMQLLLLANSYLHVSVSDIIAMTRQPTTQSYKIIHQTHRNDAVYRRTETTSNCRTANAWHIIET